ncbi:hypothetical protein OF846_005088 [Rhodotorula toruloides]|nr:hypothetical protein OF846_005088 [Rhodotorula toruloides]
MSSGSNFWNNFLNYSSVTIGNFDEKEASGWAARLAKVDSLTTAAAVSHRIEEIRHLLEYCHVLTDKQRSRLNAKIAILESEYEELQYQEARTPSAQHRARQDESLPLVHLPTPPVDRAPTPPPKDDSNPESPRRTRKMSWFKNKKKSQTYSLAKGAAGEGGYRRAKRYFGEEYV